MTEYGRGSGPEPWHPDDPLYGDQGWNGHQPEPGQVPYGGPQQYQQEPHPAQSQHHPYPQGHDPQQQYPGSYPEQQHAQQQYPEQYAGQHSGQHPGQYAQPYPQQQQYPDQQYPEQYADPQPNYGSHPHQQPQQQPHPQHAAVPAAVQYGAGTGGWDGAAPDPYGQQPAAGYPGEAPDLYGTPEAYPPPQPPNRRGQVPEPAAEWQDDEPSAAEEPEHAFFSGGGSDGGADDGDDSEGRGRGDSGGGGRRGGRTKAKKKGRNSVACLFVSLVLVGGVGGVGYYGYSFVKERLGSPEDFAGGGSGSVEVEIPKDASLGQMGRILKAAGVVKSMDAFIAAAQQNEKGLQIQPGLYPLKKEMSAAAAVEMMVNPANINALDVNPGMRNVEVYKRIDKKLGKPEGTTRAIAEKQYKNFGLPAWAAPGPDTKDPLEGFLYPARYDLGKSATPEQLLKQMVTRAASHYNSLDLAPKARALGLANPLELVTVASLVAAEGKNHDDYRKMAEVIYNRLKPTNQVTSRRLEFDSTINYIRNESTVDISAKEARALKDPYNTYDVRGLPAGPIGNPGDDAVSGALSPDGGGWMFFISIDGNNTQYTKTLAEHDKLVAEFNTRRKNGG